MTKRKVDVTARKDEIAIMPPAAVDAEKSFLGSILLDRDAIIPVAPVVAPEMMYVQKHTWIYDAQLACYNAKTPPDLTNVTEELRRRGQLDLIGGVSYLIQLSNSVPTAVHVEYYGQAIEVAYRRRRLAEAGQEIVRLAYREDEQLEDTLDQADKALFGVVEQRSTTGALHIGHDVDLFFDFIHRCQESGGMQVGQPTGFKDFDGLTGGLQRSDLLILAARPAVGKTSFALNLAYNVAMGDGLRPDGEPGVDGGRVGIFSLEMSRAQLMQRMLATATGVDMQKLRLGQIRDEDLQPITEALGVMSKLPIYIDDEPGLTVNALRSKARRMQADHGIDLIIVDYLQLMQGSGARGNDGNRTQEVSEMSRGLKQLARELNVPVIALSQLSRAVESRSSHVPMLSDLRESGSIEQDADIVMFIYREELYDPDTDKKGIAELHLAKHRNGPTGVVPLRFFRSTTRFANLETYHRLDGY